MYFGTDFVDMGVSYCPHSDKSGKYLIGPFSAGPFLTPAPLTPALIPPVLKMRLTPIRAGVKRATNFSKSGVKGAAFFGPIFTPFWPCYGLWSLNVTKNMLLAYLFG